ncbi:LLM class flavin-dependent oxidoreductase [Micromonospora sp. KC207]|uniref:LLM class flavin-dependent oxidoreductase n=1 Tax=Micromonospora sp. KC207 TaxID=2530377 RepID=UPI001044509A|nr:LLM class flavin-dependent oxidoreductase [Micromonospora sp. KC207]TDC49145.1 LLM class flavin-dependent oxidoreductase [Micromonospora sp. KC207]
MRRQVRPYRRGDHRNLKELSTIPVGYARLAFSRGHIRRRGRCRPRLAAARPQPGAITGMEVQMSAVTAPGLAIQGGTVPLVVEAGQLAERNGFHSVWSSEFYDRSAVVTLAALAAVTSRIQLGSSIAWAFARTPITLATDFRSLDDLAPGRMSMGLGTGNPQVIGDWHGLSAPKPVARLVEIIEIIRQVWNVHERPVAYDGKFFRCHLALDPLLPALSTGTLPILLAGGRAPIIRAAGAVADGLVGQPFWSAAFVRDFVHPALSEGAELAGRTGRIPVTGMIITAIGDDSAQARATAAMQAAIFLTRKSADPFLQFHGFAAEIAAVREAFERRDFRGMAAAVSERMLDVLAVFGTPQEARERYRANFESVYEQPLFYSSGKGMPLEHFRDNVHAICETFSDVHA